MQKFAKKKMLLLRETHWSCSSIAFSSVPIYFFQKR